jgi:uncharacterized membrane protein YidH (DUF202 family)
MSLFFTASTPRSPEIVRVLGIIIFVSGLITPLFGLKRFDRLLDGWSARGPVFMRVWAGLAIGLFLAYMVGLDEQAHDDRARYSVLRS